MMPVPFIVFLIKIDVRTFLSRYFQAFPAEINSRRFTAIGRSRRSTSQIKRADNRIFICALPALRLLVILILFCFRRLGIVTNFLASCLLLRLLIFYLFKKVYGQYSNHANDETCGDQNNMNRITEFIK